MHIGTDSGIHSDSMNKVFLGSTRTQPILKPQYSEILMLNQKIFKDGFNYTWTKVSENNKPIFENRF